MWSWFLNIILALIMLPGNGPAAVSNQPDFIKLNPEAQELVLGAEKGVVASLDNRIFFYSKNADQKQPIASITKLMTALVFLKNNPGWDNVYTITASDHVEGGKLNLFLGDEVKVRDLFHTSLIASDNGATLALVHASKLSEEEFVRKMNEEAKALGLSQTSFVDPVGLSDKNVSTAREVAKLAKVALSDPEIMAATSQKEYRYETIQGREKLVESTDYLLFDSFNNSFEVLGGKTGYTDKAGYCFVGRFRDSSGREIISVVLNSAGKNDRFRESKSLVNWVFKNYFWHP